jgi:hypothetical protein
MVTSGDGDNLDFNLGSAVQAGHSASHLGRSVLDEVSRVDGVDAGELIEFDQVKVGGYHLLQGRPGSLEDGCGIIESLPRLLGDIVAHQLAGLGVGADLSRHKDKPVGAYGLAVLCLPEGPD